MNTALKLGSFAAAMAAVFAAAYSIGHAVGPADAPTGHGTSGHGDGPGTRGGAGLPGGLQVSERGYTLDLEQPRVRAGVTERLRFRVLGPHGKAVRAYERAHGRELHLIVARRDLSGYRHVHPARDAAGTWSVPLTLREPGQYRVFTDFVPAGDEEGGLTLGADLAAAGAYHPRPLPDPATTTRTDGYTVTLSGTPRPGASGRVTLSVARHGRPVTDLQPYLGSFGHLVALRSGDLAYLHVHPHGDAEDPATKPGPAIAFDVEMPSDGTYRLFLDFKHDGAVHTAEFTVVVPKAGAATPSGTSAPADGDEHGTGHGH